VHQEILDLLVHQVSKGNRVYKDYVEQLVTLDPKDRLVSLVQMEQRVSQVQPVLVEPPVHQDYRVQLVRQDNPA